MPGRKTFWLNYGWSAGSAGVLVDYTVFFTEEGLNKIQYFEKSPD